MDFARFATALAFSAAFVACSEDRVEDSDFNGTPLSFSEISDGPVVVLDVEFDDGDYPPNEVVTGTGDGVFGSGYPTYEIMRAVDRCVPGISWSDTRGDHFQFVVFPSATSDFFKGLPGGPVPSDLETVACIQGETHIRFRPGLAPNPDEVLPSDFTPFETLNAQTH